MKQQEQVEVRPASNQWVVITRAEGVVGRFEEQEAAVAEGIDRAQAGRPSHLVVKDRDGTLLMDRHYGGDVWPPEQSEYYFYELSEGSRPHEGTTPIRAVRDDREK